MKLEAAILEYLIEIRKYSPRTIRGYKSNLYLFYRFVPNRHYENIRKLRRKNFFKKLCRNY